LVGAEVEEEVCEEKEKKNLTVGLDGIYYFGGSIYGV
jgi:hypothetical protein